MALLAVDDLEMRFGPRLIQEHVSFEVEKATIFAIMGGSGCGKSTLLKHMVGLLAPAGGTVKYESAALWSSMTVLENICLSLAQQSKLDAKAQEAKAREVLEWVDLADFADFVPSDLSGGMKKRAGLARAIAAEPPLLFLDEPSAGLDPISSRRLDDLILDIRERTGAAVVFVSHELPSLFAIADDGIFLDADSKHPIARGCPRELAKQDVHPTVNAFLRREVPPETAKPATTKAIP
jgi:phospholipid/cholesterol/gamma-HCH transport system ATP-binding protein